MTTQAIAVKFHDQSLLAAIINDLPHVALKPICENIGLDWKAQQDRIKRNEILNSVGVMTTSTGADGKLYQMLMMPIKYLNGWLFGVDASRVKPEIKPRLIEYQRECFDVLANHFMPQLSGNPVQLPEPPTRTALPGKLTLDQQDVIKALVKERAEALPKDMQAGATIRCWSAIKKKFGCTYKEVPAENFVNIISLLSRLPLEGELLGKPEPLPTNTLAIDLDLPEGVKQMTLSFNSHPALGKRWMLWHSGDMLTIKPVSHEHLAMTESDFVHYLIKERGYIVVKKTEVAAKLMA